MDLWHLLSSFPSAIPTVLLAVLLIYWLLSMIGLVDMGDAIDLDLDVDAGHAAHEGHSVPALAGYLVALGLGGVPLSVAASVLMFFTWLGTVLLHQYVLAWLPGAPLRIGGGIAALLFSAALAVPLAARVLRPLRGLFVKHAARANASLVGLDCMIVTRYVDRRFGRAEVGAHGASINIRVWADVPNGLARHSKAIIVAYDEATRQYEVQAAPGTM
ncbi:ubiquinone biosynthesis protein [Massilia scottii]|uniref:ubiquinone biosynthesis protein n=1 Tax=Massilia scottii TaxID=3057166 RepID=UPI002796C443|nr:ubiquinone biosynthesis protein [Massilia sp. CCM 9029]MDQ1834149.1 ubiquinone biosynthesis protein [Massilia sp. CCM 9029]